MAINTLRTTRDRARCPRKQRRSSLRIARSVLALVIVALLSSTAFAAIPAPEREALIDFYNATNGPSWADDTNWLGAPGTECTWYGVSCNPGATHVHAIQLIENNLVGTLPSSIGNLTELQILDLPGNRLTGEFPSSIWALPRLFHLNVLWSSLTGTLDPQPTMRTLLLGGNSFSGGLEAVCDCPQIVDVNLERNQIAGPIPSCIETLSGIFSLVLTDNELSGTLPPGIANLSELLRLALDGNQLSGTIPPQLGNLSKLDRLDLKHNQLGGSIPPELGNLSSLQQLHLGWNPISGNIPPELGNLTNLVELILYSNELSGSIPPELGNLSSLEFLELTDNQLSGQLPPEMANLSNLRHLDTSRNQLTGSIPASHGSLSNLEHLILHTNRLSGNIPPELGNLANLRTLDLARNQLTGSIPKEIGSLSALENLRLDMNALAGEIPSSFANLSNLRPGWLRIGFNALYSNDTTLASFINSLHGGEPFEDTQTVAPTDVQVAATTQSSVTLQWTPIPYADNPGAYRVHVATNPTGPFTPGASTNDKSASSAIVNGLSSSVTYYFRVETVTFPHGQQQNTVVSGPSEVVSATPGGLAPDVSVLSPPGVMSSYADGVSSDSTTFTLANLGQRPTTVTLLPSGTFYAISTATLDLAPGTSSTLTLDSLPQSVAGDYRGSILIQGAGVPANMAVNVVLFAAPSPPTGSPHVDVESTRIDVSAEKGTNPSGSVAFRNVGTGTATGILGADQPWIVPESSLLSIEPGQTRTFSFQIDRSRRPDAESLSGSQSGTLEFVYVAGEGAGTSRRNPLDGAPTLVAPVGINDTVKPDAVECPSPPLPCVIEIPQLGEDEVGLVVPGVGNITGSVGVFISDVSIANRSGLPVEDVTLYFADQAVRLPVDAGRSVAFADVVATVFEKTETLGALHIRSGRALDIAMNANVFVKSDPTGTFGTALPVFRTDRGAAAGKSLTMTGLRKTASSHTNIYVQELSGGSTTVDIVFLDSAGTTIGTIAGEQVAPFGTAILGQTLVPEGSVTAIVTNKGAGSIAAFATPVDRASNDTWVVADWGQVYDFDGTETQHVAVAGSAPGRNDTYFQTDLSVFAESSGNAVLRYYQQSPATSLLEKTVTLSEGETHVYDDVVSSLFEATAPSLGSIEIDPDPDVDLTVTSRTYTTVWDSLATFGTGVPTLSSSEALRTGQSIVIGGLEDSTAATTDAARPATFRTNIGLVEVDGASVRVRVSILLYDGTHLAAGGAIASRTYDLAAHQWQQLNAIVGEIIGRDVRERDFGELRNVQVRVDIVEGDGAVIVYATTTDNGTGDTVLRLD